jgi:hypothetical protein
MEHKMRLRAAQFDTPLIGIEFEQCFRLVLGPHPWLVPYNPNHNLDTDAVISWLIAEYGSDNNTYHDVDSYHLKCPGVWFARVCKRYREESLVLVCKDLELLTRFSEHFGQKIVVDTSYLLSSQIKKAVEDFIFQPITEKLSNQIANNILQVLYKHDIKVPWYEVTIDLDKGVANIPLNDKRIMTLML